MKWPTTEEQNHRTAAREKPHIRTELNVREWFGAGPLGDMCCISHVATSR